MVKAARFLGPHQPLRIEEVGDLRLAEEEALLRVRGAGICRSDIRVLDGIGYPVKPPLTLGHEFAGEIVELGSRVRDFHVGDRVVVHFGGNCNKCRYCLTGRQNQCPHATERPMYGLSADGGYAEYCKVGFENLVNLPRSVSWEFGATLGCAGVTAYHAVANRGAVAIGENVGVYGVGGVGAYVVQFAKLRGANVIAIGRNREKLDMAQKLGADQIVDASDRMKEVPAQVRALTEGMGVDVMFDMVSNEESVMNSFGSNSNLGSLANGGRHIFIAFPPKLPFHGPLFVTAELLVTGSRYGTKKELEEIAWLAGSGRIRSVVTRTLSLDEVNKGLEAVRKGGVVGRAAVLMK